MSRIRRLALSALLVVLAAAASIAIALWITPMQEVSAAGQTVQVGVAAPTLSFSGPGQLDLFGQQIPTAVDFTGPVRPRLQLTHITLSRQLAQFVRSGGTPQATHALEQALVRGWTHYFYWQVAIAGVASVVLLGAVAGWQRRSTRRTVMLLAIGLVVTEAINLGAIMVTAYTAPDKLSHVTSLNALAGGTTPLPAPKAARHAHPGRDIVVIGDSTAAGLGNSPLPDPTAQDRDCHRSIDAYAVDLARANDRKVTNLACSGATIAGGLLGPQDTGSRTIRPQLQDPAIAKASTIIVSIGANDVNWSTILRVCAASKTCQDKAEEAYFQQQLSGFSNDYLQLLTALEVLPNHPNVIINRYYNPFPDGDKCPASSHITEKKRQSLIDRLKALNTILTNGAKAASFATADPRFTGHGLCSDQPYVQGIHATAPFHPTAGGELAIALADEQVLNRTTATIQ